MSGDRSVRGDGARETVERAADAGTLDAVRLTRRREPVRVTRLPEELAEGAVTVREVARG